MYGFMFNQRASEVLSAERLDQGDPADQADDRGDRDGSDDQDDRDCRARVPDCQVCLPSEAPSFCGWC